MDPKELLNKLSNNPWDRLDIYFISKETLNVLYNLGSKAPGYDDGQYLSAFIKDNRSIIYFYTQEIPESAERCFRRYKVYNAAYYSCVDHTDYLANIPKRLVKTLY